MQSRPAPYMDRRRGLRLSRSRATCNSAGVSLVDYVYPIRRSACHRGHLNTSSRTPQRDQQRFAADFTDSLVRDEVYLRSLDAGFGPSARDDRAADCAKLRNSLLAAGMLSQSAPRSVPRAFATRSVPPAGAGGPGTDNRPRTRSGAYCSAVIVIDRADRVRHAECVADQLRQPDFAALAAARQAAK